MCIIYRRRYCIVIDTGVCARFSSLETSVIELKLYTTCRMVYLRRQLLISIIWPNDTNLQHLETTITLKALHGVAGEWI